MPESFPRASVFVSAASHDKNIRIHSLDSLSRRVKCCRPLVVGRSKRTTQPNNSLNTRQEHFLAIRSFAYAQGCGASDDDPALLSDTKPPSASLCLSTRVMAT